ncbi:replication initiator [Streptomyces sp. NPDC047315]|uniref:replication initiator n=1 Tax=Streptomyces sp. NPDC047315 TaxID=3155142 RepID=UPI0033F11AB2
MNEPTSLPSAVSALLERAGAPGFDAWRRNITSLNGCTNPVHLVGESTVFDTTTGHALHSHSSGEYGGRLLVACGNRRAAVCPACARLYRADTYHLIRAGLLGGKGVPETASGHPQVFATLTAPGFGPVHTRRERNGTVIACRPRSPRESCPHGLPVGCHVRHDRTDLRLGEPLCPRCYDYAGAVLWQSRAGHLWHRFTIELKRELARRAHLTRAEFAQTTRLSYAKVAEYQRRGLIHFHATIRLDGPDGPNTAPPDWATIDLLTSAVRTAAGSVRLRAPGTDVIGLRTLRFGAQVDVRPVAAHGAVAAYIAKYATKGAETAGAVDTRVRAATDLALLPVRAHVLRMIATCWWLGALPPFAPLELRRWAHMLGYRGHFSTKSRRYSTTLTALRTARTNHRAHQRRQTLGIANRPTTTVSHWRDAGRGHSPEAALIAHRVEGGDTP